MMPWETEGETIKSLKEVDYPKEEEEKKQVKSLI